MTPLEEIQELKNRIAKLEQSLSQPKKWEPKGGDFYVSEIGEIRYRRYEKTKGKKLFGAERPTRELAERAAKEMRIHNRLLAYRDEFCPEYEPDWSEETYKFTILCDLKNNKWELSHNNRWQTAGAVYFPEEVAKELCRKLNSGEVEL